MTAPAAFPSPVGSRAVTPPPDARELVRRAREWRLSDLEATCDVISRWDHGLVARSSRYPSTYAYNAVLVESPLDWTLDALIAFAEEALGDLTHRRVDFAVDRDGEPYRDGFESRGWESLRTVRMRHRGRLPDAPDVAISEVPYEATIPLRMRWHEEDFPGDRVRPPFRQRARARALQRRPDLRRDPSRRAAIGYTQLEQRETGAEVSDVYVAPEHRGAGSGPPSPPTPPAPHRRLATCGSPPMPRTALGGSTRGSDTALVHHDLGFVLMGVAPRGESAA